MEPLWPEAIEYDDGFAYLSLERWVLSKPYSEAMPEAVAQALLVLGHWCLPLALALHFGIGSSGLGKPSQRASMLLAADLPEPNALGRLDGRWQKWADPYVYPELTPEVVAGEVHRRLTNGAEGTEAKLGLNAIRMFVRQYDVTGAAEGDLPLFDEGAQRQLSVAQEVRGNRTFVYDPAKGAPGTYPPVYIEISCGDPDFAQISVRLKPNWSLFGQEDSPGWQRICEAADQVLATSDEWELNLKRPHTIPVRGRE